jgi:antitoxin (DNA-binding transcriptional repressor) of toxin-antitoxin stability system
VVVEAVDFVRQISTLLQAVEEQGQRITVARDGKPVAQIIPASPAVALPLYPHLKGAQLAEDAFAPVSSEEWPEDCR